MHTTPLNVAGYLTANREERLIKPICSLRFGYWAIDQL